MIELLQEEAMDAAKYAALQVADEMRNRGWTLDDIIVGAVPSAIDAYRRVMVGKPVPVPEQP